jgi:hypothetical protein
VGLSLSFFFGRRATPKAEKLAKVVFFTEHHRHGRLPCLLLVLTFQLRVLGTSSRDAVVLIH